MSDSGFYLEGEIKPSRKRYLDRKYGKAHMKKHKHKKKKAHKKARSKHVPTKILEKRLARLNSIVKSRGGKHY